MEVKGLRVCYCFDTVRKGIYVFKLLVVEVSDYSLFPCLVELSDVFLS